MKYTLIEIVHGLESDFGEEWYKRDDWRGSKWDRRRISWLKKHPNKTRGKSGKRRPKYLYELIDMKTGQKKTYKNFIQIKKEYLYKGRPLEGIVKRAVNFRASDGPELFMKYGYFLHKIPPQ